jgi:hypothetical protein
MASAGFIAIGTIIEDFYKTKLCFFSARWLRVADVAEKYGERRCMNEEAGFLPAGRRDGPLSDGLRVGRQG